MSFLNRIVKKPIHILRWWWQENGRLDAQRNALHALKPDQPKRIIIGASSTGVEGWISTDREVLDLLAEDSWARFFARNSIDAILAEHVWEHLQAEHAAIAAETCYRFLKPGGRLRVAVPDGWHPDPSYIAEVAPGGSNHPAMDHKVLYDYQSLKNLFAHAGFEVRLLEYFDEQRQFHFSAWDPKDGMIRRSCRFDKRNADGTLAYTSIILDAVKPITETGR